MDICVLKTHKILQRIAFSDEFFLRVFYSMDANEYRKTSEHRQSHIYVCPGKETASTDVV